MKKLNVGYALCVILLVALIVLVGVAAFKHATLSGYFPLRDAAVYGFTLKVETIGGQEIRVPVEGVTVKPKPGLSGTYIAVQNAERDFIMPFALYQAARATILTSDGERQSWEAVIQNAVAAHQKYNTPRPVTLR